MRITLSDDEIKAAGEVGVQRNRMHKKVGRPDPAVLAGEQAHRQGAVAEFAVAKALDLPWTGRFFENDDWLVWKREGHDVGDFEIRQTNHPRGRLILHPKDRDEDRFILVRSHESPRLHLAGWCFGRDGKQARYWQDVGHGKPCYFLPNDKLRPIATLAAAQAA